MKITKKFYSQYVSALGSLPYNEFLKEYENTDKPLKVHFEYELYDLIKFNTLVFDLATGSIEYSFNSSDFECLCFTIYNTTFLIYFDSDIFDSNDYMLVPDFFDNMDNVLKVLRNATIKDFKIL